MNVVMASPEDLEDLSDMAFSEIQQRHAETKPPINRNELILYLKKSLDISLGDAREAVILMEKKYLEKIMTSYPHVYDIGGVHMDSSAAANYGTRFFA